MSIFQGTIGIAITFLFLMVPEVNANAKVKVIVANEALTCIPSSPANNYKGNCPYPSDVAKVDAAFKRTLNNILKNKFIGSIEGPESQFSPIEIGGEKYLYANFCQQHMCGEVRFDYLYLPSQTRIVGLLRDELDKPGKQVWIGNPSEEEKSAIRKLMP